MRHWGVWDKVHEFWWYPKGTGLVFFTEHLEIACVQLQVVNRMDTGNPEFDGQYVIRSLEEQRESEDAWRSAIG